MIIGLLLFAGCQSQADSPTAEAPERTDDDPTAVLSTLAVAEVTVTPAEAEIEQADPTIEATSTLPMRGANADVEHVRAIQNADGSWTFRVTVRHPDTGWEDYADGWDVVTPDGQVLKVDSADPFTRLLLHPHENEQPFTRSQSGVIVPDGVTTVIVRAHDLVDGFGGQEISVDLTADAGPGFEVERQ
jgi:hypothetical protein